MNIGNNIMELRKKQKLSQEGLAEKLGVTRQTISNWKLGESSPEETIKEYIENQQGEYEENFVKIII